MNIFWINKKNREKVLKYIWTLIKIFITIPNFGQIPIYNDVIFMTDTYISLK